MKVSSSGGKELHHLWLCQDMPFLHDTLQQGCNVRGHLQQWMPGSLQQPRGLTRMCCTAFPGHSCRVLGK